MANIGTVVLLISIVQLAAQTRVYPEQTTPTNDAPKGPACLGGSEPAYQHDASYGNGSNSWTIHLEGGGWCLNYTFCIGLINNPGGLGSRSKMQRDGLGYGGIQSPDMLVNPAFLSVISS